MLLEPKPTAYDVRFPLLRIPVRIHPLFWLATAFLGWQPNNMGAVLTWIFCVLLSILVHEFGHALTARHFQGRELRVVLYYLGGLAIHSGAERPRERTWVLLMGPGAGLLLGALVYGLHWGLQAGQILPLESLYATYLVELAIHDLLYINLLWSLVNLLPIYPLDGGQLTQLHLMARRSGSGLALAYRISLLTASACCALAIGYEAYKALNLPGYRIELYTPLFFGALAYISYTLSRPEALYAQQESLFEQARQPWEQDPDWWRKEP